MRMITYAFTACILALLMLLTACSTTVSTTSEYMVYYEDEGSAVQTSSNTAQSTDSNDIPSAGTASSDTAPSSQQPTQSTQSSASEIQPSDNKAPVKITEFSQNNIEFIGRFAKEGNSYLFAWSGSTISAGFVGTELAVNLSLEYIMSNKGNGDYVEVIIDGVKADEPIRITKSKSKYTLATGLSNEYHYISIVKRTEGYFSTLRFDGFDYLSGKPAAAPARKSRRIEFLGDSITAGYGNMAAGGSQGFKMSQEDATNTYGYLTAQALNAEATIMGSSGNGFSVKNWDKTMKTGDQIFNYSIVSKDIEWNFDEASRPQVLVINFGANDFAQECDTQKYCDKYSAFLDSVREKYPDTYIICAIGTHSVYSAYPYIQKVVNQRIEKGDKNITAFKFLTQLTGAGMSGADNHPSAECHALMAEELSDFIKSRIGW